MEYVWKCFDAEGVTKKAGNCKITIFVIYLALFLLLTLAVAAYSYAAAGFEGQWFRCSGAGALIVQSSDLLHIERLIRLIGESFVLGSVLFGHFVQPAWFMFTGSVGILLMIFALTDFCPMSIILYACGAREYYKCYRYRTSVRREFMSCRFTNIYVKPVARILCCCSL
jgi:hypothetical protein